MNKIIPIEYQLTRAGELFSWLVEGNNPCAMLTDQVGYGKTFEYLFFIQRLANAGLLNDIPCPYPVVIVTKASVVEQTRRAVKDFGLSKYIRLVTNYDQLRSDFGEAFVKSEFQYLAGQEQLVHTWYPYMIPRWIILDECHSLKNELSLQSSIVQSLIDTISTKEFKDLGCKCQIIFSSASPFTRLSETKYFLTASRVPMTYGWSEIPCDGKHWKDLAYELAGRTAIEYHSPTAMKRMREYMSKYIFSTKYTEVVESFKKLGRTLHKAKNGTLCIPFRTVEQQEFYTAAWKRYLEALAKIDRFAPGGIAALWVAIGKFRQAAEECRAPDLAELMYQSYLDGQAPVCFFNYKKPLALAIAYLVNRRGISRDKISAIWGGLQEGEEDYGEGLELGAQSRIARQKEIDKFQSDKSDFCFYTLKAGGAGLSLHQHKPEMKVRRTYGSPTYSAIEVVQGLGRVPRVTSWSDTEQTILFYKGTIEEHVAAKMDIKLRSLREVVAANETWAEELVPNNDRLKELIRSIKLEDEDDTLAGAYLGEDEDEDE